VPTFIRQALANKPLTVFGDGLQTRSFCFVSDLIEGLYRLATSGEHLPVNLGNPTETSLLDLAAEIIRSTGSESVIVHQALPMDDPKVRRPDITRAMELLGWQPSITLGEGLANVIAFESDNRSHSLTALQ
jgi:dTDP-glucose 4,6-dehydratase